MFDFVINNQLGFLIAFIPALLNLAVVFYIYFCLPANRLTAVFALFTLSLCLWQFDDSVLRICPNATVAGNWDVLLCASWIFVGPLCLHFALLYCNMLRSVHSRIFMILLYGPAAVFSVIYCSRIYSHAFTYDPFWGWANYHDTNPIDALIIYWVSLSVVVAAVMIFRKGFRIVNDRQLKIQTLIIAAGIAIPTIAGIIGQVILPLCLGKNAIPLTSTFLTFFSVATVVSLSRYRLFNAADMVSNEQLIDHLPVMIFTVSEKRRVTYINRYGADLLGLNRSEAGVLTMRHLLRYVTEDCERKFFSAYSSALQGKTSNHVELSFMTARGKTDVIISGEPLVNNNQVHGVLFAARDITELKASHELMRHKELLLEDAQQIAHIGSWEYDPESGTINCSDELSRIYGYTPEDFDLSFEGFLQRIIPDDRERVKDELRNAFHGEKSCIFYAWATKKDGTQIMLHMRGKVVRDENGRVKMNGTVQDVTEEKCKEDMLSSQNEELKKINLELDKFVYSVSHDLRAPLLSMQGVVDITLEESNEEGTVEHMKMLKSGIVRLDNFINEILTYSRNARTELNIEPIDFNEMLGEISNSLRYMEGNTRPVKMTVDVESENFYCDRSRLNIVLNNLISNAIRYQNPDNGGAVINVRIKSDTDKAILEVQDNGIGIKKEFHSRIFEMFYRVSERSSGSGLGLYIVKEAVTRLKGNIAIESERNKGTTFHVEIPNFFYQ